MRRLISAFVAPLFVLTACSSEPKTYEDCVFKYIPSAKTKAAALYLRKACETKFKKKIAQATKNDINAISFNDPVKVKRSRATKEIQLIYVEGIGNLEFPSDMSDAAITEAIHRNFPEFKAESKSAKKD